jgi:hypothetical protein
LRMPITTGLARSRDRSRHCHTATLLIPPPMAN